MSFVRVSLLAAVSSGWGAKNSGEILLTALAIYVVLIAFGRLLKRRYGTRLGAVYQLFCIVAGLCVASLLFQRSLPGHAELGAVTALLGAGVLIRLIDQYFWRWYFEERRKATVPKFIREVAAGGILLAVGLLVLQYDFGVKVPGLLAASGVVGIILGLALQDALGNVIAGFTIHFGRPFKVGDWLLIGDQHVRAVEINWRSTRFVTNNEVQLDVPNQQLVKQTITNFHGGSTRHAMHLEIGIDYDAPPNRIKDLLAGAATGCPGVLADPAPNVFLKSFDEHGVIYGVRFWINDHDLYNPAADAVRTNIWYTLQRHGVRIPSAAPTLHLRRAEGSRDQAEKEQTRTRTFVDLLGLQPVFSSLDEAHLKTLIGRCPPQHYGRGESIIREGQQGDSMFVLLSGQAGVTVRPDESPTWLATLRTGDCFGEMSLLTGEKRSATVLASDDCEVMEITREVFAEVITQDPDILPHLSELLAHRQLNTEGIVAAHIQRGTAVEAKLQEYQAGFLQRLSSFFEL